VCALTVVLTPPLVATTVIAPSFSELVERAEVVFEGEVVATDSRVTVERDGTPIVTLVTFRVLRLLKGKAGSVVALEFLGGTAGNRSYRIDGMPTFRVGDRDVLFAVTSQRLVSPLVGMMHGRVRIVTDPVSRETLVRRHDGQPLREVSAFGQLNTQIPLSQAPAMSLAGFENAVLAEVARQAGRRQ
jgi:hypothetical protein